MNKAKLLFVLLIALAGCSEQRKISKATAVFERNLPELAKLSHRHFPPQEKVTYLPGKVVFDTLYVDGGYIIDTIPCPASDTPTKVEVRIEYKDRLIREKTVDTLKVELESGPAVKVANDRAAAAEARERELRREYDVVRDKVGKKNEMIWWMIAAVILCLGWIFRSVWIPGFGKLFTVVGKLFK